MGTSEKKQERVYNYDEINFFRKTKESFGGLSNMASGFPLNINSIPILTSEALYQACRFPYHPEVQKKIINERSPMTAKMVSKPFREHTRQDWDKVRVDIMYWCLKVKLAQNFISFGQLLETTYNKPIVEESSKDPFWGAIKNKSDNKFLTGINALGRLLMKLRQEYNSEKRYDLLYVEPLDIPDFFIYNVKIQPVDERQKFVSILQKAWKLNLKREIETNNIESYLYHAHSENQLTQPNVVSEPETKTIKGKKKTSNKKQVIQSKLL